MPQKPQRPKAAPRPAATAAAPPASGPGAWLRWSEPFLIPVFLMLVARIVYAYFIPAAAEDAYITFRYARNFANGHGLVFNPGERVMGFTSPLWTLWMSLGFLIRMDSVLWSRLAAIGADVVTLVLVAAALRRTVSRASAWCFALFFAGWPYFAAMATSGMENNLMLMLMALSAVLVERRHPAAPGALAALAYSRPEGVVAAAILALGARRRDALVAAAITAAAYLPLLLYYGSVIPQSVFAKSHIYGTPGPLSGSTWWIWLIPRPYVRGSKVVENGHLVTLAVFFTPALIVGARRVWALRQSALARLSLAGVVIWIGYSLLGVAYFYWYLMAPLAALAIVACTGLPELVRGRWLWASLIAYLTGVCWDGLPIYFSRSQIEFTGFVGVADYLTQHAHPGEKAFLEPIGMIGFECPLVIVDEIGLVSPEVARRRLQGPGWYTDIVALKQPDWLVMRRILMSGQSWAGTGAPFRGPEDRAQLLARYAVVDTVAGDRGDQALLILRRQ